MGPLSNSQWHVPTKTKVENPLDPYMVLTNIPLNLWLQLLLYLNHFSCILFHILYIFEVEHDIITKGLKQTRK